MSINVLMMTSTFLQLGNKTGGPHSHQTSCWNKSTGGHAGKWIRPKARNKETQQAVWAKPLRRQNLYRTQYTTNSQITPSTQDRPESSFLWSLGHTKAKAMMAAYWTVWERQVSSQFLVCPCISSPRIQPQVRELTLLECFQQQVVLHSTWALVLTAYRQAFYQ